MNLSRSFEFGLSRKSSSRMGSIGIIFGPNAIGTLGNSPPPAQSWIRAQNDNSVHSRADHSSRGPSAYRPERHWLFPPSGAAGDNDLSTC